MRTRYSRWVCSRNLCAASKSGSFSLNCEATGAYAACTSERSIAASKLSASPSYAAERNTADAASPVFEMILFPSLAASASRAAVCCAWHAECHQTRDEAWHLLLEPGAQRMPNAFCPASSARFASLNCCHFSSFARTAADTAVNARSADRFSLFRLALDALLALRAVLAAGERPMFSPKCRRRKQRRAPA